MLARDGTPPPAPEKKPAAPADIATIWPQAVQLVYARRPLIKTWIDAAHFLGTEGHNFLLGFAPDRKTVMESLSRPTNRSFLDGLLKELTGTDWKVKLSVEEHLPETPSASETAPSRPKPGESVETFKNDPLIKEALEIFKGEIKSVST